MDVMMIKNCCLAVFAEGNKNRPVMGRCRNPSKGGGTMAKGSTNAGGRAESLRMVKTNQVGASAAIVALLAMEEGGFPGQGAGDPARSNQNRVTITDAEGAKVFDVMNGKDGSAGPAGTNGVGIESVVQPRHRQPGL